MRRRINFSLSLFLLLCFALPNCFSQKQNVVKIKATGPYSWDFGKVKEGKILKHNFILKNDSPRILTIKDIYTSCGCTVAKVKDKIILASRSTIVEIQFNTGGYSGPIEQYVYIHTDNLDNPIIKFIIEAYVESSIPENLKLEPHGPSGISK